MYVIYTTDRYQDRLENDMLLSKSDEEGPVINQK